MKRINSFILILLLFAVSLLIVMPALAQDDPPLDAGEATTDTPVEPEEQPVAQETSVPVDLEPVPAPDEPQETNPWLRFVQMLGNGINSFVGGASFMAGFFWLTGKLATDKKVIGLLETATQGLRDSYPPETRQWIVDLGTGIRNVGMTIEEIFDDIPIADKPDPNSLG